MSLQTVIVVNDFAHVEGGASQVAITTALGLAGRGLRVILLAAVGPLDPRLTEAGVVVHCLGQDGVLTDPQRVQAALRGWWNRSAADAMGRILAACDPNRTVIHLHGWTRALSASIIPPAVKAGVPIVCTLHDYFTACPNGAFYDFQAQEPCGRAPLSAGCLVRHCDARHVSHKLWRVARQVIQQQVGGIPRAIRTFIAVSAFSLAKLRPYLPSQADVRLVANPIDLPQLDPVPVAMNRPVAMIGRLAPEKGPRLLALAARQADVPVQFVGDGPEADALRTLLPEAGFSAGWVDRDGVAAALAQARAVIVPSRWFETQCLVVLEAAARGVPAIVSDGCAARELVDNGRTGLWFRQGSVEDLARQLRRLDDDTVTALGQAAYERYWAAPYTTDRYLDRLIDVLSEAVAPAPAVSRPG
jgi:glycosyltransferase involved in cell wall biosynthesis